MEVADQGDLKPLIEYFAQLQREQFLSAMRVFEEIKSESRVADTIGSIRRRLQDRQVLREQELEATMIVAEELQNLTENRLDEVTELLRDQTTDLLPNAWFQVDGERDGNDKSYYFRNQIVDTAQQLDYWADLGVYRAWSRLRLKGSASTELLISFHGVGRGFRGVLGCSASWFQRVETESGEWELSPVTAVCDGLFLINHNEAVDSRTTRFSRWLESAIDVSLKLWSEAEL